MEIKIASQLTVLGVIALFSASCSQSTAIGGDPQLTTVASGILPIPRAQDLVRPDGTYTVGPYDQLSISVYGLPELALEKISVDANGNISAPLAGSINVLGLTSMQIEQQIADRLRANYIRDPRVTVNLIEAVSHAVTVDGQVRRPGQYPVAGGMTLLRSIALAQGLNDNARLDDVVVFRNVEGRRYAALYNLGAIRRGRYADPTIYANDIVMVGDATSRRLFKDILTAVPGILAPVVILLTQ